MEENAYDIEVHTEVKNSNLWRGVNSNYLSVLKIEAAGI